MINARTLRSVRFASLLFLVAGSMACGFMGTEVGNGAKDSNGEAGSKGKKATAASEPDKQAAENSPESTSAPGETDADGSEKSANDAGGAASPGGGQDIPTSETDGLGTSNDSDHITGQPLVLRLLGASCASPLSQELKSPLHLLETSQSAGEPTEITATRTGEAWTVSVPGDGDLFKVSSPAIVASPYSVVVTTPEGEEIDQGFACGEAVIDDNASLAGISGTLQKVTVDIRQGDSDYKVTWYIRPSGAADAPATLERFEVEDFALAWTTIMTAVASD